MKRRAPLRVDPDKVRAWKQRGAKAWNNRRRRSGSELDEYKAMRDDVRQRAEGLCECRLSTMCDRYGNQAHHILPRSKGGGDHVDNLAWVCQPCHTWIHNHPTASRVKGLLK